MSIVDCRAIPNPGADAGTYGFNGTNPAVIEQVALQL